MIKSVVLLYVAFAIIQCLPYERIEINKEWNMNLIRGPGEAESLKSKVFKTTIPTTVHLDLQAAGAIPDPFATENYPKVKWVSDCDFRYAVNFTVSDSNFNHDFQKLVFEGIDTYADVSLNGHKILSTENAFRTYTADVKNILVKGTNQLQVLLNSTNNRDNEGQRVNSMPFAYAHTRKPGYQYSWDWAPFLNTLGIWKGVFLESYNEIKIDYVWARTRSIRKEKASVNFAIALDAPRKDFSQDYVFRILQDNKQVAELPVKQVYTYHDVIVANPQLWWPNGIGKPHIYDFTVLLFKGSEKVDEKKIPFGIRTVELDLTDKKFQVKVNGYMVYCKGANYVPPDMFYPRLENSAYKAGNSIENLINSAVDSNFNMIRVWGGGQYESEKFLELASRKGIMLFYDFMFSDSIYPSTEGFLLNVEEEVKQQIRRARNYPALTLWSGNNQILQGINDWGWGRQNYKQDYHKLFEILIPKIIQYESPYIPYIPSSPVYGVGNYGLERGGDAHFWAVWAGGSPFETYLQNIARFNSEFGTQSLPVWETIVQAITDAPSYENNALLLHQRHNSRFTTLKNYMNTYMKKSLNFELETYQSGLLQAYAIELAIKGQRAAKPKSAGTLYWQFNDAWPAISWSSIDYFGRWKPLQFMAKRLYPDIAIFTVSDKIYAISDKLYPTKALAIIEFFNLNGQLINKIEKTIDFQPNGVELIYNVTVADYKQSKKEDCVVYTEIVAGKTQIMSSTYFNAKFKDLNLHPAEIQVEYFNDYNAITITAKSAVVKNLFISHKDKYLKTSNNYFDLLPGHPVKVIVENAEGLGALKGGLKYRSYREVYTESSQVTVNVK